MKKKETKIALTLDQLENLLDVARLYAEKSSSIVLIEVIEQRHDAVGGADKLRYYVHNTERAKKFIGTN